MQLFSALRVVALHIHKQPVLQTAIMKFLLNSSIIFCHTLVGSLPLANNVEHSASTMSTQWGGGGWLVLGQDHVCAIIADSLMNTSNEMCGDFFVHTMKHCCICKRYPLHMRV